MKNLYDVLYHNRKEALEKLKKFGNILEFPYTEDPYVDERPWVFIAGSDGICDMPVSKVNLAHNDTIMLYIEDWDEWVDENECLSTTIDNVYQTIGSMIN